VVRSQGSLAGQQSLSCLLTSLSVGQVIEENPSPFISPEVLLSSCVILHALLSHQVPGSV
jgi:hypothetical protein